jgi:hypothetical protein
MLPLWRAVSENVRGGVFCFSDNFSHFTGVKSPKMFPFVSKRTLRVFG